MFDDSSMSRTLDVKHLLAGRRRWRRLSPAWWTVAFVGYGVALLAFYLSTTYALPDTSWESYQRIGEGMTEYQVAQLLGAPPGGYGRGLCDPARSSAQKWREPEQFRREWGSGKGIINVGFDADGKTCRKS